MTRSQSSRYRVTLATLLDRFASVEITLGCLLSAMVLVVLGTLAQVHLGTFEAQKVFFNSWWVYSDLGDWKLPTFPGGLTIGSFWMASLIASFVTRFRWERSKVGLYVTHAGIILLLGGQFFTQSLARESHLPLLIGQTRNYSESQRETELAVIKTSDPEVDEVTSISERIFSHEGEIHPPRLPFYLVIRRFFPNAELTMTEPVARTLATQGIGTRIAVRDLPPVASDDQINTVAVYVEVLKGKQSLGIWLVSSGLGAPQSFNVEGNDYSIALRPRRFYFPFTLTLKEFHHDIYPGTDIPKNFSSLVRLANTDTGESREALIYMNNPLRYQGKTFYQASFGEGDRLSVFQVVENPAAAAPYLSCALITLGLMIQFLSYLIDYLRKRS